MNGDDMRDLSGSQLIAAPRGLEEIVVSFGDIYNISAGWEPRSAVAGRLSHQRGYSLLFAAGVGSVAAGEPDDLSQADGRNLCLGLRPGTGTRTRVEDRQFRWMLCVSSATNRDQTLYPQLGDCD
jgi:hypothetical protein